MPPKSSTYTATKNFNKIFGREIASAYSGQGIDIMTVKPSFVSTNLIGYKKTKVTIEPEECASGVIRALGSVSEGYGHKTHEMAGWAFRVLAPPIVTVVRAVREINNKN